MPRVTAALSVAIALSTGLPSPMLAADLRAESLVELSGPALGSELQLSFAGLTDAEAQRAGARVLAEIGRLDALLSTRRTDSELTRLNQRGSTASVSPDLIPVLQECETWRLRTGNAFSCRLGQVESLWEQAASTGEIPDRGALRRSAMELSSVDWKSAQTGGVLQDMQLEPGMLSRGWIVDAALATAKSAAPAASAIRVRLGGLSAHWSARTPEAPAPSWPVDIEMPTANGSHHYGTLHPQTRAIAFSDVRKRQVGDRHFSYILDPADGWPVEFAPSAVVVAADAVTAGTLATALAAMPINRGIAMIDRLPDTEALVVTETGRTFASSGWYSLLQANSEYQSRWKEPWSFTVEYQIPRQPEAEYRRPYAALWITNGDNELVRQLTVHGDNPRWLRDLSQWWRRFGRRDTAAIDGLSRATPLPGRHTLSWDGRDEQGRSVADGDYVLHIEAAREHGGRERVALPFRLSDRAIEQRIQGEAELGQISIRFTAEPTATDDRIAAQPAASGRDRVAAGFSTPGSR